MIKVIKDLKVRKYITPSVYAEAVETGKTEEFNDNLVTEKSLERKAILVKIHPTTWLN